MPNLEKQLKWSDEDFRSARAHVTATEGTGTVLQRYPVPLLDARVSALWTFDTTFQRSLLTVRQDLYLLDDLVDRARKYMDMTFLKQEGDNYRLIQENFTQACSLYAERAKGTVDRIRTLTELAR